MCGRAACDCDEHSIFRQANKISKTAQDTKKEYGEKLPSIVWLNKSCFQPFRCNITPTEYLPVVRPLDFEGKDGIVIDSGRWGFKKNNSKLIINARIENLGETYSHYRCYNRCVVLVTGFIEWSKSKNKGALSEPYYFYRKQTELLNDDDVEKIEESACILQLAAIRENLGGVVVVTTQASKDVQWCHERMPVVLKTEADAWQWINPQKSIVEIERLFQPVEGTLTWHRLQPNFAEIAKSKLASCELRNDRAHFSCALHKYTPRTLDTYFSKRETKSEYL